MIKNSCEYRLESPFVHRRNLDIKTIQKEILYITQRKDNYNYFFR